MLKALPVVLTLLACAWPGSAQKLLPWQQWLEKPVPEQTKHMEDLMGLPWQSTGGPEGKLAVSEDTGPWGGKYLNFHVKIDHFNAGAYPVGWPAIEVQPKPNLDFSGYDAIQYWIRCDTKLDRPLSIRFILWTNGAGRIQALIPPFRPGPEQGGPGALLPVRERVRAPG